jgi:acetyl-CoA decarbonylase/synthase complex subunit gamma
MDKNYIIDEIDTASGAIPVVALHLTTKDLIGTIKVRWSIGRDNYKVDPGLYAVGKPNETSDVFVTANYKLSFDHLRKNLYGLNAWILVLDTKGVNVWCAAGKKTFGTEELVYRIKATKLEKVVTHRRLILPQLGAVGISAHKVKEATIGSSGHLIESSTIPKFADSFAIVNPSQLNQNKGFTVIYGPVRASDIKSFINNGYKTTAEMRRVTFNLWDRAKLIPVDFMYGKYKLLIAMALVFVLAGVTNSGILLDAAIQKGWVAVINIFIAYFSGIVLTPILLPYVPFRMFAFKGLIIGLLASVTLLFFDKLGSNWLEITSWFLIIPGISSFLAMNFTGSSTYTSLSGVKKEMKIAVPVQIGLGTLGLILMVVGKLNLIQL